MTVSGIGRLVLQVAVTAGTLAWLWLSVDVRALSGHLAQLPPLALPAFIAVLLPTVAIAQALRWRAILSALGASIGFKAALQATLLMLFLNEVVPIVGGDLARIWRGRQLGLRLGELVVSVVLDRIAGATALLALCVLAVPFLYDIAGSGRAFWSVAMLLAAMTSALAVLMALHLLPATLAGLPGAGGLVELSKGWRAVLAAPSNRATVATTSLVAHCIYLTLAAEVTRLVGAEVSLVAATGILAPVLLTAMLPISLAGWGVREGGMIVGLALLGVPADVSLAASLVIGAVSLTTGVTAGCLWAAFAAMEARRNGAGSETRQLQLDHRLQDLDAIPKRVDL